MAEAEICTSKSCVFEQSSLIQTRRLRSGSQDATTGLGCSTKIDQDDIAKEGAAHMGYNLAYGCLDLKGLCLGAPPELGGSNTTALIRTWCPETCGVPCKAGTPDECPPVYQCDWGNLTTVAQTAQGCDVVTCTPLTDKQQEECPWLVGTTDTDSLFECANGTSCGVDNEDCCKDKGGRVKCPPNYPYMCNEPCPLCDPEGVSFSCQTTTCNANGGYRTCDSGQGGKGGKGGQGAKLARWAKKEKWEKLTNWANNKKWANTVRWAKKAKWAKEAKWGKWAKWANKFRARASARKKKTIDAGGCWRGKCEDAV